MRVPNEIEDPATGSNTVQRALDEIVQIFKLHREFRNNGKFGADADGPTMEKDARDPALNNPGVATL